MEILKASKNKFNCLFGKDLNNISCKDLIYKDNLLEKTCLSDLGFLVVKNVLDKKVIKSARDAYFSLFERGEYEFLNNDWIHLKNHKDSHGCKNHPSITFLKKNEFLNVVNSTLIKKISKKLLKSESTIMSPRMIVRSFSRLSERCTYAHRDKEYFNSFRPKNVITCWIPLGLVGSNNGQLIYLLDSHKREKEIDKLVNSERIISKDFNKLSNSLNLKWYRPIIEIGDVIFHSLEIIHASFDSLSNIPRLSIDLRFAASDDDLDPRWSKEWRGDDGL